MFICFACVSSPQKVCSFEIQIIVTIASDLKLPKVYF